MTTPHKPSSARLPHGSLLAALAFVLLAAFALVTRPHLGAGPAPPTSLGTADPAALRAHVIALSETYAPRGYDHPENLDLVAAYVVRALEVAGARDVHDEPFEVTTPEGVRRTYRNVVARVGGDREPRLVVGAHYDAAFNRPGADDNASGVAALVELARLLARTPPERRVDLVAYSLEEPPFFATPAMGSAAHARRLASEGVKPAGVFVLETLGYYDDAPGSQRLPLSALAPFYPSRGDFVALISRLGDGAFTERAREAMRASDAGLGVYSLNGPTFVPGVDWSDHRSYWPLGVPALMVTDTALYRNARYHTPLDLPSTLDYGRLARATRAVAAAVLDLGR